VRMLGVGKGVRGGQAGLHVEKGAEVANTRAKMTATFSTGDTAPRQRSSSAAAVLLHHRRSHFRSPTLWKVPTAQMWHLLTNLFVAEPRSRTNESMRDADDDLNSPISLRTECSRSSLQQMPSRVMLVGRFPSPHAVLLQLIECLQAPIPLTTLSDYAAHGTKILRAIILWHAYRSRCSLMFALILRHSFSYSCNSSRCRCKICDSLALSPLLPTSRKHRPMLSFVSDSCLPATLDVNAGKAEHE
jgi:hypothetical protein